MAYEAIASSAGISNFDISKYLDQTDENLKLQQRYRKARAISSKVDKFSLAKDQFYLSTTKTALKDYNSSLAKMDEILQDLPKNISSHIVSLRERFDFHFHKCVDRQEFNLHNAYVRYFIETEKFFFDPLLIDYRGLKSLINITLHMAEENIATDTKEMRNVVFWPIKQMLIERKKLTDLAMKEINKITERYTIARKLTGIPLSYRWRYDKIYQEPGLTTGDAFSQNKLHTHVAVLDALTSIRESINRFIKFGNHYGNKNYKNWAMLYEADESYVMAMEAYMSALHRFEHDVVRAPYKFIQNEVFNSHMLNTTIDQEQTRILKKMNKNLKLFKATVQQYWHHILDIVTYCSKYKNGKISKSDLAEVVTSQSILDSIEGLHSSMVDLTKSTKDARQELEYLKVLSESIWNYILLSPFYKRFYEKLYNDTQLFLINDSYTEELVMPLAWLVNYKYDRYILANLTLEGKISKEDMVAMISNADVHTLTIEGVYEVLNGQIKVFR